MSRVPLSAKARAGAAVATHGFQAGLAVLTLPPPAGKVQRGFGEIEGLVQAAIVHVIDIQGSGETFRE